MSSLGIIFAIIFAAGLYDYDQSGNDPAWVFTLIALIGTVVFGILGIVW